MKKYKLDLRFLYLFIPLLYLEIVFHLIQFKSFEIFSFLRVLFFVSFFSFLVSFICTRFKSRKVYFVIGLIIVFWFSFYTFVELIFKNFMGDFYSFGTVSDGAARIAQYALIFLSNAKPVFYLCLLTIVIYILLFRFVKFNGKGPFQLPLILCILSFLLMIPIFNLGSGLTPLSTVYDTFSNKDILIDKTGIEHFFFRDISALVYKAPEQIVIDIPDETDEPEPAEIPAKKRTINDTEWKKIAESEENSNMQMIDKYLMSKQITQPNEMTGLFEGYNFIYFMVEAGDYMMIDKELTPTLYKMYNEGLTFYNHYTPVYSCATGESEFVSYTSIFPYVNVCTPNYVAGIEFYEALPYLFKNKGYKTFGLHNWRDEFYERKTILPALGVDEFYDIDDIWEDKSIVHTNGWQSDTMLIEQAIKHIEESKGKFFCDIITSVMHFPYDESSYWGDYYLDEINEVHPDWRIDYKRYMSKCMDFDNGMKVLLDYLEEKGIADNTVICFYCDHRPYWISYKETPYDLIMEYSRWLNPDRSGEYGQYRSPFVIYNPATQKNVNYNYCSTLDHVPTIANLFDLNYDPRLYMGIDAYSGSNTIIFPSGNWLNETGVYDATTEKFTPADPNNAPDQSQIMKTNTYVQNTIKISYLIFDEDYFAKRRSICNPK
ncbi:MAG: sulfatase-like hydrolase/transferase [Erysipelotrichaceae bacterium]|nr:sulfatase-like hydrolase/transferase [Erysipelotrichaceae bacterium]